MSQYGEKCSYGKRLVIEDEQKMAAFRKNDLEEGNRI